MQTERIERRLVVPEVARLAPFGADAVAGRTVEGEAEVQSVAVGECHGAVELDQRRTILVDGPGLAVAHPERVGKRHPHESEPPARDPAEVVLQERGKAAGPVEFEQVEAAPAGQGIAR